MAISVGERFAGYEVAALIGVGGMGEVYRATDPVLKRSVALKVLSESFVGDANRLARLQREAELLAALNHGNVAHIYGLERSEGTTALVMEFIEGPTLAERIAQGPIPVDEALRIATQIADALEAAHERGIVHRDLKPANIKLRPDGTVKVLDFGVAKALDTRQISGPGPAALTTPAMTEAGFVLGTAAYMSPEQARGKPVDRRVDVWAFGCVLYEMLTGQAAFGGDDVTTTLARVLEREADLRALSTSVSADVRQTIKLCLQKDPRQRARDIGDVKLALQGAFNASSHETIAERPFWRRALPVSTGLVAGGALMALVTWWAMQPSPPAVTRFAYSIPEDQTFGQSRSVIAVSPDGRHFAYSTTNGLYLRAMDELDARLIPGTAEDTQSPFFSPDGKSVAYFSATGELKRIALTGGVAIPIANFKGTPYGATWEPDGTIFFGQPEGVFRVSANGGRPEPVVRAENGEQLYGPELLPSGDTMLFSVSMGDESTAQLVAQSLPTGKRTVLVDGAIDARYLPTGHLVYARSFDLFALAFDADTLTVSGSAVPVAQGLAPGFFTANYGVAKSGTLVYLNAPRGELTPVWVDRHGHEEPLDTCNCRQPAISPDGKRVAFSEVTSGIDILSVPEHRLMRLSFGPGGQFAPVWTLDGERVVYWSGQGLLQRRADGTGTAEPLTGPELSIPEAWTADGRLIIDSGGVANGDIDILTVTGERTREPLLATTFGESRAALSPDNRWLAYQSNESGRNEIYVRPFPDVKSGEWRVSMQGGEEPKWSRDGRSLFFLGPSSLMEAPIESGETFTWGSPKAVFDRKGYVPADVPHSYDVSPDGQRFLMIKVGTPAGATARIVVVENWSEDLKRLVPTK